VAANDLKADGTLASSCLVSEARKKGFSLGLLPRIRDGRSGLLLTTKQLFDDDDDCQFKCVACALSSIAQSGRAG